MIEQTWIHFYKQDGVLVEHRFRSSMPWSRSSKLYARANDLEAIERCKLEAMRQKKGRDADLAEAHAYWFHYAQAAQKVMERDLPDATPPAVGRASLKPHTAPRKKPPMPFPAHTR